MALTPVARRSIADDVFAQIADDVLRGEVQPGETLPSERHLAELLGVSRPSVREALKRLDHAGLVDVRQGDSTTVRDFRQSAGMDLLPRLLTAGGTLDLAVARSVLETRLHVGPFAAELAARRGAATLAPALTSTLEDLKAQSDPVGRQYAALSFWDVVIDGADSIALRLMYNGLRASYEPVIDALAEVMDVEVSNHAAYRKLASAISAGRASAASKAASDLLRPATDELLAVLESIKQS